MAAGYIFCGFFVRIQGNIKTPSLSDSIFRSIASLKSEFKLLLDLYDETWVLEHRQYIGRDLVSTDTTALVHVNKFSE
jgi:hypothetical protein